MDNISLFFLFFFDDHLVASNKLKVHLQLLDQCFGLLKASGLQINQAKCVFAVLAVDFWAIVCTPLEFAQWTITSRLRWTFQFQLQLNSFSSF